MQYLNKEQTISMLEGVDGARATKVRADSSTLEKTLWLGSSFLKLYSFKINYLFMVAFAKERMNKN
jgi:hypothetical protein